VRNVDSNGGRFVPNVVWQTEELAKSYGSLVAVKDLTLEMYEGKM
jgi:ABC-type branched-subunit amino acid transport system ATPase component